MIIIINIILIAVGLSMDAFSLALAYGIKKMPIKTIVLTSVIVGIFHFFMPLLGNKLGVSLFEYTFLKPKIIVFFVFLILSLDMLISFFENNKKLRHLNLIGILSFAISVSLDSFSVGIGISYLYNNILLIVSVFCVISMFFTILGFVIGKKIGLKLGKYSFLIGSIILFIYAFLVLTK